jgi:hypothetical protein
MMISLKRILDGRACAGHAGANVSGIQGNQATGGARDEKYGVKGASQDANAAHWASTRPAGKAAAVQAGVCSAGDTVAAS